jgi:cobalt-zinc-cadmium efflux system outer membrane protein
VAAALSACASSDPQASFDAVASEVSGRSALEAAWPRDDAAEAALRERARALLAQPLTPEAAAQVALWRNRQLLARFEEIGISQADYAQAGRLANPSLSYGRLSPGGHGRSAKIEASLIEDLLDPLLLPLRKRLAAADLEATRLRVGQAMLDTVGEAKRSLVEAQAAASLVERLRVIAEVEAAAVALAERQREAGDLTQLDLERQRAELTETRLEAARAESEALGKREAVNRVLGLIGAETSWIAARNDGLPGPVADSSLEELALERRLDVRAASFAVERVESALRLRRRTRFLPGGLRVGVAHEREPDRLEVTGPLIALELPIFDTGAASIARLAAEYRFARRQAEDLEVRVRSRVRELRTRLAGQVAAAREARETLLPQRVAILDQTLRHYNAMVQGVYDVLAARRAEIEAERVAIEAWRDAWVTRYDLETAVGGALPTYGDRR